MFFCEFPLRHIISLSLFLILLWCSLQKMTNNLIMIMMTSKQRLLQVATCLTTRTFNGGWRSTGRPGQVRQFGLSVTSCHPESESYSSRKRHSYRDRGAYVSPQLEYRRMLEEVTGGVEEKLRDMKTVEGTGTEIRIPLHLIKKLEKRKEKSEQEWAIRERIVSASRRGNRSHCIIHCKNHKLNHYKGQSYARNEETLASRAWRHRKSAGDFFTIFPKIQKESPFYMSDTGEMSFADLGINELICKNLEHMGISKPTHIQVFGIPELLSGKFTIVAAETGCGKTLVYLLAAVNQILMNRRFRIRQKPAHPSVIILTPSRELSDQIYKVALQVTKNLGVDVRIVQGGNLGVKIKNPPQTNVDILIATTNAIKVLSTAGVYGMSNVQHIILDEADTLLDDSFFPDLVGPFLNRFPWTDIHRDMQLTLVGATLPKDIKSSLGQFLKTDDFATCSTPGLHSVLPHVSQTFLRLKKSQKAEKIKEIVAQDVENKIPVIIFCNKTTTCHWLASHLNDNGIDCASVHGKMPLKMRNGRIEFYQRGELNVIVCTDLASRGIDTVRTQHVINYEFPLYTADYIHRCGRTGRVGSLKNCRVTNFISRLGEVQAVNDIERSVRKEKEIPDVNANIKRMYQKHYGQFIAIEPIHEKEEDNRKSRRGSDEDKEEDYEEDDEEEEEEEEEEEDEAAVPRPRRR